MSHNGWPRGMFCRRWQNVAMRAGLVAVNTRWAVLKISGCSENARYRRTNRGQGGLGGAMNART